MDKQNNQKIEQIFVGGYYRKKIIEMVNQIENEKYIKMIYAYVRSAYREEKSRD